MFEISFKTWQEKALGKTNAEVFFSHTFPFLKCESIILQLMVNLGRLNCSVIYKHLVKLMVTQERLALRPTADIVWTPSLFCHFLVASKNILSGPSPLHLSKGKWKYCPGTDLGASQGIPGAVNYWTQDAGSCVHPTFFWFVLHLVFCLTVWFREIMWG